MTTHDNLQALDPRRRRPQLNDEAAAHIRELIMSGHLQPGQFLRPDALASELAMSATPVREALLSLRGEGFVLLEPRRGFVVAPLSADDIRDLFSAQALLAGELAARACGKLTDEDLDTLDHLQQQLDEAARDGAHGDMELFNHAFHRTVNQAAASPKLAWALSVATRYVPRRFYATISGWPDASMQDHSEIISALRAHNSAHTRSAMSEHVTHAGSLLARHLEQLRAGQQGAVANPLEKSNAPKPTSRVTGVFS